MSHRHFLEKNGREKGRCSIPLSHLLPELDLPAGQDLQFIEKADGLYAYADLPKCPDLYPDFLAGVVGAFELHALSIMMVTETSYPLRADQVHFETKGDLGEADYVEIRRHSDGESEHYSLALLKRDSSSPYLLDVRIAA